MKIKDCRVTYGVLKVNRISSWLKEAKPTVKNVGIDELRDQVIDQFQRPGILKKRSKNSVSFSYI